MNEFITEGRKEKIKAWFKDPYNLAILGVILVGFILRLYYFILIKNQPLWWDEAVYGSLAKNMVMHTWDGTQLIIGETAIRPILFSFIWSLLLRFGIQELASRFILLFIPSVITIFLVYLIGKEFYGKRIGIIASFIFSVLWIHLFYTLRFLVHMPAIALVFLSIFYFIKSTKSEFNFKYFAISLFSLSIATLMRYPKGLIFIVYLLFLLINGNFGLFKKSKFWISGILGLAPLLIFFIINLITLGNIFPTLLDSNYISTFNINAVTHQALPFAFNLLNYIPTYLQTVFFIFFLVGLGIVLFELLLGYNFIIKDKNLKNHLFLILIIIAFYAFFIFVLRAAEDRYFFTTALPLSCFSAVGIDMIFKFVRKYNKYFAVILVLIILSVGAYSQLTLANSLIQQKNESFLQIKQGFEWIKDNTLENSTIIGSGIEPYAVYYAERKYALLPANLSDIGIANESDYLVVHAFTPQPEYINQYLQDNEDQWQPINAFFFDKEQKQVAFVVYRNLKKK